MLKELFQNKIFWVCVVLFVVIDLAVLLGSHFWEHRSSNPVNKVTSTEVVQYVPNLSDLPKIVENGSCFANSVAAPYRADAWRCTVGNSISDPCFQIPNSPNLLCDPNPVDVSSTDTFVMKLTSPLPKAYVAKTLASVDSGWFIELADGTICTPFTGTLPFSKEGDVADYSCNSTNATETMIFNGLNNKTTPWTAEVGELALYSGFPPPLESTSTIAIKAVWQ